MDTEDFALDLDFCNLEDIKVEETVLSLKYEEIVKTEEGLDKTTNAKTDGSHIVSDKIFPGKSEIKIEPEEIKLEVGFLQDEIDDGYVKQQHSPTEGIPKLTSHIHSQDDKLVKRNGKSTRIETPTFTCQECKYLFMCSTSLKHHVLSCRENKKPYHWNQRNSSSSRNGDFTKPLRTVNRKVNLFKCSYCSYSCIQKCVVARHIREVHEKKKPFECSECKGSFSRKFLLSQHLKYGKCSQGIDTTIGKRPRYVPKPIAKENVKFFKCEECEYTCYNSGNVSAHFLAVHRKLKPFKCHECETSFNRKDRLAIHIRAVHQKEKSFKCGECSLSFFRKDKLAFHVRAVHRKEKGFKCNECEYACTRKYMLSTHMQAYHENLNLKEKKCRGCDFSGDKYNMLKHSREVQHKDRPYKCSECFSFFSLKCYLLRHVKYVHEDKDKFACHVCGYTCNRKDSLKKHIVMVHNK